MEQPKNQQKITPELQAVLLCCHPDRESVFARIVELFSLTDFTEDLFTFWARQVNLAPLVIETLHVAKKHRAFADSGIEEHVTSILGSMAKTRLAFLINSTTLGDETNSLVSFLSLKGIWCLPLKGPRLEERIFGGVGLRVMGDIDLLVKLEEIDVVLPLLQECGYVLLAPESVIHERIKSHHLKMYKQENRIVLELHWYPVQPDRFVLFSERFWSDQRLWLEDGSDLSLEGLWLYLIIHHHEHAYGEFKTLVDSAWTTSALPEQTNLFELARSYDLHVCWVAVCRQLHRYLGPSSRWSLPALEPSFIQKRALSQLFHIPLNPGDGIYRRKLAARLLIPHISQILASAFRAVFPPKEAIAFLGSFSRWKYCLIFIKRILGNTRFESVPDKLKDQDS